MNFVTISVKCSTDLSDAIVAELFEIGFDSFQEFDDGFEGSCGEAAFKEVEAEEVLKRYPAATFSIKEQERINWNEEWEKNYDPIIIDNRCHVRATFHKANPVFDYDILVNPKMSFGTGHHATTYQMLSYQMNLDHQGKKVLDVGCGTGILAIMAAKRGASQVMATDIDDWCIENSAENFTLNEINDIQLIKGEIGSIEKVDFDIIIANINKNVLMDQIREYSSRLIENGVLLLSGFYKDDISDLLEESKMHGLVKQSETEKDRWAMLALTKPKP
ncbi:MAG: 50S ribosomal protein L11 methyltransferase [Cyclobacteriaceae bacterium]